jgi:RNA polymerase sigma-70 factor (ECF subfamily)
MTDLASVGRLLEQHRSRLLQMVRRRIDPGLAVRIDPEEILHEAFLVACRKWVRYRTDPTVSPYAWLYRIVLDCLIETWRRESRGIRDHRRDLPWPAHSSVQLALHLVDSITGPSSALAREEQLQRIKEMVEDLGESDHEILWMRHYDQLSFREAAAVLKISENAATVRYARALRRLRDKWLQTEKGSEE